MINAAHIGVGISGLEGQQAARAADYSIGQFKYLKNLMFVHGREAYRRNSYLILYMFYKDTLLALPIFYFGFWNGFACTPFYDNTMYMLYNVFFTAIPVCWYGVFDFQHTKRKFLSDPSLYKLGLKNLAFNRVTVFKWYFYAIWQSFFILYLSFYSLDKSVGKTDK